MSLTLIIVFIIVLTYNALTSPLLLYGNLLHTLEIWLYDVFPPIFIFYIVSSLILSSRLIDYFFYLFKPLKKIFKFQSDNSLKLLFISVLVGNPSSSSYINDYYTKSLITKDDYECLICYSSFITPLFIFNIFPKDIGLSFMIYLSHISSNLILLVIRTKKSHCFSTSNNHVYSKTNFFNNIRKFPNIILLVATMMLLSSTIITTLTVLNIPNEISSFIEIGSGINYLKQIKNLINLILIVSLLSSNGLCINLQVYTLMSEIQNNFSFLYFIKARLIQTILSVILFLFIYSIF